MTHPAICPDCDAPITVGDNTYGLTCAQCRTYIFRKPGGPWKARPRLKNPSIVPVTVTGLDRGVRADTLLNVGRDPVSGRETVEPAIVGICLACGGFYPYGDLAPMAVGVFIPVQLTKMVCQTLPGGYAPETSLTDRLPEQGRGFRAEITKGLGCPCCRGVAAWWSRSRRRADGTTMNGIPFINLKPRKADAEDAPIIPTWEGGKTHAAGFWTPVTDEETLANEQLKLRYFQGEARRRWIASIGIPALQGLIPALTKAEAFEALQRAFRTLPPGTTTLDVEAHGRVALQILKGKAKALRQEQERYRRLAATARKVAKAEARRDRAVQA